MFSSVLVVASRVERVVMLALLQIILSQLRRYAALSWIAIIFFALWLTLAVVEQVSGSKDTEKRVLRVFQRLALYVTIHSVMRATMPPGNSAIKIFTYGFGTLGALSLLPRNGLAEAEQSQLSSQITYAYATATEGILQPLQENRTFVMLSLFLIFAAPQLEKRISERVAVAGMFFEAFDLVVFDSFTTAFFIETGDNFADIAIIVFVFVVLWHAQERFEAMRSIQQFTSWRIAGALQQELSDLQLPPTLAIAAGIAVLAAPKPSNISWLSSLVFLLTLNITLNMLQQFLNDMGNLDAIPVLLSVAAVTATVNDFLSR